MKSISTNLTSNAGENLGVASVSPFEQSPFTPRSNLSQGAIKNPEGTQRQDSAKTSQKQLQDAIAEQRQDSAKTSQKQLQDAIAEQRLTDCLEHLESLNFLGEETQLFCLNLAQHLQRGCGK